MLNSLQPYPQYKNSGEMWLGDIPSHWKLYRTKALLSERNLKGFPDEPLLAATQTKGVVRKEQYENRTVLALKDLHLLKLVRVGDFVISLRSFQGGIEYAREQGIISPAYTVLYPKDSHNHSYLAWLFKSKPYIENLSLYVTGIRQGQNIDYEKLSRSAIPLPPLDEQKAIVQFLDHIDRRIKRYIRAKQKLIKLLNEQKQAIIQRAVTRGVDNTAPLKFSKNKLIEYIPAKWEITELRRYWNVIDCKHVTVPFVEEGIPLASVTEAQSFDLDLSKSKRTTNEWYQMLISSGRKPQKGDLIYCRNTSVGACAYINTNETFAMGQDVCLITSETQNNRFLNYVMHSPFMKQQLEAIAIGSTFKRINVSDICKLMVVIPPLEEQNRICKYLDYKIGLHNQCIRQIDIEINKIKEYLISFVTHAVTGKIDVREAHENFQEELHEAEFFYDLQEDEVEEMDELEQLSEEG